MPLEVEQAVLTKGVASPSPFILLHPSPPTKASPTITAFRRPTGLLFQYLVGKIALSPRYSSVLVTGLEDHPQRLIPPPSSSSPYPSSSKMILVDGFSDPLGLDPTKDGALALDSPEAMVTSLQAILERQAPSALQRSPDLAPVALLLDSLHPLLQAFGLPGCLQWVNLMRKQLPGLSPLLTVLWPQGLAPSTLLALEDRADTNIYLEACTQHEPSRLPQNHGSCRVVRKSSSGRVQEGRDYYQLLGPCGKMVVRETSCCPLDVHEGEKGADDEEKGSQFLEDLAAQLRLKQDRDVGQAGEVAVMGGGGGARPPEPALIYMEEGDPEFDDEDEDDGLDDDLDL